MTEAGNPLTNRSALLQHYVRRAQAQGLEFALTVALHPGKAFHHLGRIARGDNRQISNFYPKSVSREAEVSFCAALLGRAPAEVESAFSEIETDGAFIERLRAIYAIYRPGQDIDIGRFKVLYAVVRLTEPDVVLETGVHDGLSSAVFLHALSQNCNGRLISIDLPTTELPLGARGPGWLVPDELMGRWELILGDSRKHLPKVVNAARIDTFHHDSDHSARHQEFELRTVRPFLASDGILLLDDCDFDLLERLAVEWKTEVHQFAHVGGLKPGSPAGVRRQRRA